MKIKRSNYKILIQTNTIIELLYYVSVFLILFNIYFTYVHGLYSYIVIASKVGYVGLFVVSIFKRFKLNTALKLIVVFLLCGCVYFYAYNLILIKTLLLVLASKDINIDRNLKINFYIRIFLIISVIILFYYGKTDDYIMIRNNQIIRSGMGFGHPNTFAGTIFSSFMIWCYFKLYKMRWYNYVLAVTFIIFIDILCNSRTAEFVMIISLILLFFAQTFPRFLTSHIFKFFMYIEFVFMTVLSLIGVFLYRGRGDLGLLIDNLLTGRLRLANSFLEKYGITLFGNKIEFISSRIAIEENTYTWVLDNMYLYILVHLGIIAFILIFLVLKKIIDVLYETNNMAGILVLCLYMIFGLSETGMLRFEYNSFIILGTLSLSNFGKIRNYITK
ncbi:MAG: hypothetical protein ACLRSU_12470 [Thomasclavelia spiroformis]|uniref:hypothetical protein n=1 Tax=Thomasclavelia spiroformis TaxID=29348 RepID=UPI003990CAE7